MAASPGEIVTGWRGDRLVEMGNGQHATMYLMFALTSVAEAARFKGYELVPGLEYVIGVMAFLSEALLFAFHGNGTSEMEMLVSTTTVAMLFYSIIKCLQFRTGRCIVCGHIRANVMRDSRLSGLHAGHMPSFTVHT